MNLYQSMSKKINCHNSTVIENFFGLLKKEMYYGEKFYGIKKLNQ